jgi:hypothetical protein
MSAVVAEVEEEISDDFIGAFESDEIIQDEPEEKDDSEKGESQNDSGEDDSDDESNEDSGNSDDDNEDDSEDEGEEEEQQEEEVDPSEPSEREKALEREVEELKAKLEKPEEKDEEEEEIEEEEPEKFELVSLDDLTDGLSDDLKKDLEEIYQDFPSLKAVLEKVNDNAQGKLKDFIEKQSAKKEKKAPKQELKTTKDDLKKDTQDLVEGRFWTDLLVKRPEAKEVSGSKKFQNWLNAQPDSVQNLANSLNVDDAISVLNAYDASQKAAKAKRDAEKKKLDDKNELNKTTITGDKKSTGSKSEGSGDEFEDAFYEED